MNASRPSRFLIFNNGMLGNTLFNMPAAAWLKQNYPGCHVGMVVDSVGKTLILHDPNVDTIHVFNKKKDSLRQQLSLLLELRKTRYNVSFHLRKGVRNELLARLAGIPDRAGFRLKGSPQHLTLKLEEDTSVHRLESRALLMEAMLGRPVKLDRPRLNICTEANAAMTLFIEQAGAVPGNYFVLHPTGNSQNGKDWSLPVYAQAAQRLAEDAPVFIICMPCEEEAVNKAIPSGSHIHYYTGSIANTSELIRNASVFLGNDSGPAHLACAWEVPRLVVYKDDEANYTKWKPIHKTGCTILFAQDFNPETVFQAVMGLKNTQA